ncbi:hypothetical protein LBMAG41_01060 [Cyanobium sp.]|jgi:hypothetical protein|nr:hypothetical protein LBMAG41_01060 [Cyanobium sp.]
MPCRGDGAWGTLTKGGSFGEGILPFAGAAAPCTGKADRGSVTAAASQVPGWSYNRTAKQ